MQASQAEFCTIWTQDFEWSIFQQNSTTKIEKTNQADLWWSWKKQRAAVSVSPVLTITETCIKGAILLGKYLMKTMSPTGWSIIKVTIIKVTLFVSFLAAILCIFWTVLICNHQIMALITLCERMIVSFSNYTVNIKNTASTFSGRKTLCVWKRDNFGRKSNVIKSCLIFITL